MVTSTWALPVAHPRASYTVTSKWTSPDWLPENPIESVPMMVAGLASERNVRLEAGYVSVFVCAPCVTTTVICSTLVMGVEVDSSASTTKDSGLEQPAPSAPATSAASRRARLERIHVSQGRRGGPGRAGRVGGEQDDGGRQHHQPDGPPEPVLLVEGDGAGGGGLRRSLIQLERQGRRWLGAEGRRRGGRLGRGWRGRRRDVARLAGGRRGGWRLRGGRWRGRLGGRRRGRRGRRRRRGRGVR